MMKMSEKTDELFNALALLQSEVRDVERTKAALNYKYADLEQMLEMSRPILKKYDLAILQPPISNGELAGIGMLVTHKSGQYLYWEISSTVERSMTNQGKFKMSFAQEIGCLITFFRKYSLAGICGFTQKDDDGKPTESSSNVTYEKHRPTGGALSARLHHLLSLLPPEEEQNARVWYKNQGFTQEAQVKMLNKLEARFNRPVLEEEDVQGL